MFARDALEIRFVEGAFYRMGPATAWFRMRKPIVAGEQTSPLQRLAAAGDFGNGIAAALPWDEYLFINPDLTLYIDRLPVGEWIGAGVADDRRRRRDRQRRERAVRPGRTGRPGHAVAAGGTALSDRTGARGRRYLSRKALIRTSYCWASRAYTP